MPHLLRLGRFALQNVIINALDMGSDFNTFTELREHHPKWAAVTLFWMFMPLIIHLVKFVFNSTVAWRLPGNTLPITTIMNQPEELTELFFQLPLLLPLRNCYYTWKLYRLGFDQENFKAENSVEVEHIYEVVGLTSLYESYFEAGPQAVTQIIIVLIEGRFSWTQRVSVGLSLVSLSWGASRAYFIQRPEGDKDPDPKSRMVILRVFPYMVAMVLNSLAMWIVIGGLLGPFTFIPILITFGTVFFCLKKWTRKKGMDDYDDINSDSIEASDKMYFLIKASACSVWLPCVIGNRTNMFAVSVIASVAAKFAMIVLALILTDDRKS